MSQQFLDDCPRNTLTAPLFLNSDGCQLARPIEMGLDLSAPQQSVIWRYCYQEVPPVQSGRVDVHLMNQGADLRKILPRSRTNDEITHKNLSLEEMDLIFHN